MFRDGAARVLVFRLGDERFAVDLTSVDEVIDAPATQSLPDAPPHVVGITTLRGTLATLYDPRPALDIAPAAEGSRVALVFAREDKRVLLAVDDVDDALAIEESEVRSAPAIGGTDLMLVGLIRRADGLVALLDAAALLDAVTTGSASGARGERT